MNFEELLEQQRIILRKEVDYFNKHNVKSPTLARLQNMLKLDNEDFKAACKGMR